MAEDTDRLTERLAKLEGLLEGWSSGTGAKTWFRDLYARVGTAE